MYNAYNYEYLTPEAAESLTVTHIIVSVISVLLVVKNHKQIIIMSQSSNKLSLTDSKGNWVHPNIGSKQKKVRCMYSAGFLLRWIWNVIYLRMCTCSPCWNQIILSILFQQYLHSKQRSKYGVPAQN